MKKIYLFLGLFSTLLIGINQTSLAQEGIPDSSALWIHAGGLVTAKPLWDLGINFRYKKLLTTIGMMLYQEAEPSKGLFGDQLLKTPSENMKQISCSIGTLLASKKNLAIFGTIGIGFLTGTARGSWLKTDKPPSSGGGSLGMGFNFSLGGGTTTEYYENKTLERLAIPIEIMFHYIPTNWGGINLKLHANINSYMPLAGIGFSVLIGKLKLTGPPH